MTMQHRFKMPPGGSARDCWETPVNCSRIAPAIIESKEAIANYRQRRAVTELTARAAPSHFPYAHRTQKQVREQKRGYGV